jgi:hypothetical protein
VRKMSNKCHSSTESRKEGIRFVEKDDKFVELDSIVAQTLEELAHSSRDRANHRFKPFFLVPQKSLSRGELYSKREA